MCPATALMSILMSGPTNPGCGENQPMKYSIALRGELKATFSTGSSCDLWPVTRGQAQMAQAHKQMESIYKEVGFCLAGQA